MRFREKFLGTPDARKRLLVLMVCTMAAAAVALQPPVLALSNRAIQQNLRAPDSMLPLFAGGATLFYAAFVLAGGALGDAVGRRRMFLIGLGGLFFADILLMTAPTREFFIVVNFFAGVCMGLVMPMAVAVVTLEFQMQVRGLALAVLYAVQTMGIIFTAVIASEMGKQFGFAAIFFIPLALIAFALAGVWKWVPESQATRSTPRLDVLSHIAWVVATLALIYGILAYVGQLANETVLVAIGISIAAFLFLLLWNARKSRQPIPLYDYTARDLALAVIAGVAISFGQGALFFQFTTFLNWIWELNGLQAVMALLPFILTMLIVSIVVGVLVARYPSRVLIAGGLMLMGAGMLGFFWTARQVPYWVLVPPLILLGTGVGLANMPRVFVVLTAVPRDLMGTASAVNQVAGQFGNLLGIIFSSVLVTRFAVAQYDAALQAQQIPASEIEAIHQAVRTLLYQAATVQVPQPTDEIVLQLANAFQEAFALGIGFTLAIIGVGLLIVSVLVWIGMTGRINTMPEPSDAVTNPRARE